MFGGGQERQLRPGTIPVPLAVGFGRMYRGMHHPTVGALRAIGIALNVRADEMLAYAGWLDGLDPATHEDDTEAAIRADTRLTPEKKRALLAVYRTLVAEADSPPASEASVASED